MANWQTITLYDAGVQLIDCVHATPAAVDVGYPYVAIPDMKNGRIDFTAARRISRADFETWTKKALPRPHDVVLSRRTNPGVTAAVGHDTDFALGQNLVLLRADGRHVIPEFLRWLVSGPLWWEQISKFLNVGAVFDSLKCVDVPKFTLPVPPKHEQRRIVEVLTPLEEKIDLNRRMNGTLEAMARAIFKDWFVDFGPTRAKMEGRSPYLTPGLWALFPDRFSDDGKPEGWRNSCLGEIADLNPPERLPTGRSAPYLDMAALPTDGFWPKAPLTRTVGSGARFRNGDTLFARITPCLENGKTAYVTRLRDREVAWGSTEFIVIRPRPPFPAEYGYLLARDGRFREHAIQSMTGTSGRQRVQADALSAFPVCFPPPTLLEHFAALVGPLFIKIHTNELESETIAATRDLVLPKLMSGEVRVREAETIVEATT